MGIAPNPFLSYKGKQKTSDTHGFYNVQQNSCINYEK